MDLYLYSTNNIHSTSTPYSYFHSTQIFFQLQLKLFYFNQKVSIQLLYLKFPDIPNVYQQKLTVPSQIRRTFDTPTQSLGMRSQNGVGRRQADPNSTEWNGATTSGSASNASLLPRTRNREMRPDRRAGKRLTLPVQKWKLRSKPKFQHCSLVCFRLRERGNWSRHFSV